MLQTRIITREEWETEIQESAFRKVLPPYELCWFVENGVTYEPYKFTVTLDQPTDPSLTNEESVSRCHAGLVHMHGGIRDEFLLLDRKMAEPLRVLLEESYNREAFFLCLGLFQCLDDACETGRSEATANLKKAFVEGRLRKRKLPGRQVYKVWVEKS